MRQEFTIKGRLCSLNEYVAAAHTPWKRTKLKQEQEAIVADAAKGLKPMEPPVEVRITYYEGRVKPRQRVRDLDNVAGAGNKFIMDALVSIGILPDDDAATVNRAVYKGFATSDNPRIVVTLENGE